MKKKKLLSLILATVMVVAVLATVPFAVSAGEATYETDGGHDKTNKVYYIKTAEQFKECFVWLDNQGDSTEFVDKIVLLADIDMAGISDFKPAAGWKGGTFDGQGHIVKNLTSNVNEKSAQYNADHSGLFMDIKSSTTIKDVAFINMTLNNPEQYDGGMLMGNLTGDSTRVYFLNVVVTGTANKPEHGKLGYFASAAGKKNVAGGSVLIENCVFVLTEPEKADIFTLGWLKTSTENSYGEATVNNSYALNVADEVVQHDQAAITAAGDDAWANPTEGRYDFLVEGEVTGLTENNAYKIPADQADTIKGGDAEKLGDEFTYAEGKYPFPHFFSKAEAEAVAAASGLDFAVTTRESHAEPKMYTITWKVGDQTYTTQVEKNTMPSFKDTDAKKDGTGKPIKEADENFKYKFKSWTPMVDYAVADVTYVAEFTSVEIPKTNQPTDTGTPAGTTAPTDTAPAKSGGCGGAIGVGAALVLVAALGAVFFESKKNLTEMYKEYGNGFYTE